jgi:hypothetical protein
MLRGSGATNMRRSSSRIRDSGISGHRTSPRFIACASWCAMGLIATLADAGTVPVCFAQEKADNTPALSWTPPHVYEPIASLSTTPPCVLPDVLNQARQRAEELIDHLQNFNAHEHVRFEKIDRDGLPEMSLAGKFDYLVDFGEQSSPLATHEIRSSLEGTDDLELDSVLDTGLPAMALIFHASLQSDYEMRCEGFTQWNNRPAWVISFCQRTGKKPRTITMVAPTGIFPVSIRGRAWIAAGSGHIVHLETNLVKPVLALGLRANATSIDYAPVKFESKDVEFWLPKAAIVFADYGTHRTVIEHTFSDFRLFSVHTDQVIEQPKSP